jgi:Transposase DDE domain
MSAEAFAALPDVLRVRELHYSVSRKGIRVKTVTLVTTLLDPKIYTAEKLAEPYGMRRTIETSFGHIKTTMKMDVLRCQAVRGILKAGAGS